MFQPSTVPGDSGQDTSKRNWSSAYQNSLRCGSKAGSLVKPRKTDIAGQGPGDDRAVQRKNPSDLHRCSMSPWTFSSIMIPYNCLSFVWKNATREESSWEKSQVKEQGLMTDLSCQAGQGEMAQCWLWARHGFYRRESLRKLECRNFC
jgi:hypothetical protein